MTTLDTATARCLGKTTQGKPNGCHKAYNCARHVALRTDPPGDAMLVHERMCGDEAGVHAFFIQAIPV